MIGIPILGNTVLFGLLAAFINAKFDALIARFDAMDEHLGDRHLKSPESR
jgi:hypothetical protein